MDHIVAAKRTHLWNEIELADKIGEIIKAYNTIEYGDDRDKYIIYEAAYPDWVFNLTGEGGFVSGTRVICYDIIKKDNGSIGSNQYDSKKRIRPILMERRPVVINQDETDEKGMVEDVYAKHYDITFRFDCLAPSDRESMDLIRNFERMIEIHSKYLETGCKRFIYDGRRPSYFNRDTRYKSRSFECFAQVEEQWGSVADRIDEINTQFLHYTGVVV